MNAKELELDYFLVYDVSNRILRDKVFLQTQFDPEPDLAYLNHLTWFANPVSKNGEPLFDERAHLSAYMFRQIASEPIRKIVIKNQFGEQKLTIGRPGYLLTPAVKLEGHKKFSKKLDHFKVYRVLEGRPIEKKVKLKDQFGTSDGKIYYPFAFAAPAKKKHWTGVYPIKNKHAHLVLYRITPRKFEEKRVIYDQFGKLGIDFDYSFMLAAPSLKLKHRKM